MEMSHRIPAWVAESGPDPVRKMIEFARQRSVETGVKHEWQREGASVILKVLPGA